MKPAPQLKVTEARGAGLPALPKRNAHLLDNFSLLAWMPLALREVEHLEPDVCIFYVFLYTTLSVN